MFPIKALLLAFVLAAGGSHSLSFKITPQQAFSPATVRLTIYLQPNASNRFLCVDYVAGQDDDEGSESSDCQPVNGADAPTQHIRTYKDIPAGNYLFQVRRIEKYGDEERTAAQPVTVLPR